MQRQINDVDRDDVNIKVRADTSGAMSELKFLSIALAAVAALPVVPVAVAGIGSIAAAAVAAGAGVGALALVAVPAIKSVTNVMQLQTAATQQAARATDNSAASNVRAAQNALQLAGAQASLTSAHRQAAQAIAQANEQVANSERALTEAKKSVRQAEEDLATARKDAAEQLRSLNDQLLDGKLSERQAVLDVKQAQEDLNKVLSDPTATDLQRQQAQLAYDEAQRNAQKTKQSNADLQKQVVAANKAGVEGSDVVKQAKERVAEANAKVADQERALADARAKVRDAEIQGAEQVASAERALQAAQLSSVDTTAKTATAADTYRAALAKLTPAQRDLYDSIAGSHGLKAAFTDWATSLQPQVLPLFTRGVNAAKSALPGLTPLVRGAADAVGVLWSKTSRELRTPFWGTFKHDLDGAVKPAIIGFGTAFGNVFRGVAGVLDGFLPHTQTISDRLIKTTERFSEWGTSLNANPSFEKFLKFSSDRGAVLADVFGKVATAFLNVGESLTPISGPLLKTLGGVADALGVIAGNAPWLLQFVYAAIVGWKLWTLAVIAFNFAVAANPLVLIGLAIVALVGVIIYAWDKWGWFRAGVEEAWAGIKAVTLWAWNGYLKPSFVQLWHILAWVGGKVVWLNDHIVAPVFRAIGVAAKWLYDHGVKPPLQNIWNSLGWLGSKFGWLYDKGVAPVVHDIADGASWLYSNGLKPVASRIGDLTDAMADSFRSMSKSIKVAWDSVVDHSKTPVNFIIKWVYTRGIKAVWDGIAKFVGLDPLPKAPKLLAAGGTIGDGWGAVRPMVTNRPTAIVGEGNPRYPEYVIPTDPKYRSRALALHAAAGTQLLEDGGILGSAFDVVKGAVSKGVNWASTAADLLAHPSKVWAKLVRPILDSVAKGVGSAPMGKALAKLPVRMVDGLEQKILDAVSGGGSADVSGLGDLGAHGASAKQAQKIARAMLPAFGWDPATQMPPLISLWNGESGWRWNALNPSSGAYGIPQSLPASKMASAGPDWRTNPATQIRWGMDYVHDRYGSPAHAYSTWLSRSPRWYDDGGYLPTGLSLVANGTGSPEPIFTGSQWEDIRRAKSGTPNVTVNAPTKVYIDGQEIRGIVDQRIEVHDGHLATMFNNGRKIL
ncbi:MAG: hypothetical protein JF597_25805 [Streptomyces sp.]|uniref:aggregation-promoting factor C-terminal-like domain-containing protein n=1 Tax=Streptomyces sp. TaxID=1931 RepID=UPI0025F6410F|nr:hypothetical protein [Streptomyces sp.]MBW8796888.1 hypothetical protein [Streptomyces sp.]